VQRYDINISISVPFISVIHSLVAYTDIRKIVEIVRFTFGAWTWNNESKLGISWTVEVNDRPIFRKKSVRTRCRGV